jgi:hypothetical protein
MFDEHEVPHIIDALLVAEYKHLPHWCFVHGRNHITLQYGRRGMSIVAPPNVWAEDTNLFDLGDGEVIAGRLERLGWRRRPSYGFTGPGAAVTMMSSATTGSELWLDIRGPKPYLVRAALDPLGVAQLTDVMGQEPRTAQRTAPDVTAHPLVSAEVYLPSAYTGVIVAARDTPSGSTLCHVRHADGMIEQSLAHRPGTDNGPTAQALSLRAANDIPRLRLAHDQQGGGTNLPPTRHPRTRPVPWLGGQAPGLASNVLLVKQLDGSCSQSWACPPSRTGGTTWIVDHAHGGPTATPF